MQCSVMLETLVMVSGPVAAGCVVKAMLHFIHQPLLRLRSLHCEPPISQHTLHLAVAKSLTSYLFLISLFLSVNEIYVEL